MCMLVQENHFPFIAVSFQCPAVCKGQTSGVRLVRLLSACGSMCMHVPLQFRRVTGLAPDQVRTDEKDERMTATHALYVEAALVCESSLLKFSLHVSPAQKLPLSDETQDPGFPVSLGDKAAEKDMPGTA